MGLDPKDIMVEAWHPQKSGGMLVGMPKGVKATHIPTGCSSTWISERSMHHNQVAALKELEELVREKS